MIAFLAIMVGIAAIGTWLTERVDRPNRRLENARRLARTRRTL